MVGLQRVGTILVAVSILAFVVELLVEAPELRLVSLAAGILLYGLGSLLGTADAERDRTGHRDDSLVECPNCHGLEERTRDDCRACGEPL